MTPTKGGDKMNGNELKGFIIKKGFTISDFLIQCKMLGAPMSRNTFYRNLKGVQEFTRKEIIVMSEILEMTPNEKLEIFFEQKVS